MTLNYSKAVSWINDCRIPFVDEVRTIPVHSTDIKDDKTLFGLHPTIQRKRIETTQGRFPANLLVSDDMLNDGSISKGGTGKKYGPQYEDKLHGLGVRKTLQVTSFNDKGTNSRYYSLDAWWIKLLEDIE